MMPHEHVVLFLFHLTGEGEHTLLGRAEGLIDVDGLTAASSAAFYVTGLLCRGDEQTL